MAVRNKMSNRRATELSAPGRSGRRLALALAVTVVALAIFSVSHIHGISDPSTPHPLLVLVLSAQAHTGFLLAPLVWIFLVLAAVAAVLDCPNPSQLPVAGSSALSRAPPSRL